MKFEKRLSSGIDHADFSTVILTYNSSSDLALCLVSLHSQNISMDNVQIIIVDDGSTDSTQDVVECHRGGLKIDYFILEHTGIRGANRNFGVSKVKAEMMLLLDGDMILSQDFLQKHIEDIRYSKETISMGKR